MPANSEDALDVQQDDKVRVRSGPYTGVRGTVRAWTAHEVELNTTDQETIRVDRSDVTNFSLAARKAWKSMPKRAGRPVKDPQHKKKMVSMRLDAGVWERLGAAVSKGWVSSREEAVNTWVNERLNEIISKELGKARLDGDDGEK